MKYIKKAYYDEELKLFIVEDNYGNIYWNTLDSINATAPVASVVIGHTKRHFKVNSGEIISIEDFITGAKKAKEDSALQAESDPELAESEND